MKTKLIIDDDLKRFLTKEIDRTNNLSNREFTKYIDENPFNMQWKFKFNNGYGASVIKHWGSYGFENDLFELAVISWDDNTSSLCYDTEITDDVIGHLTNQDVMDTLRKIKDLKKEIEKDEN